MIKLIKNKMIKINCYLIKIKKFNSYLMKTNLFNNNIKKLWDKILIFNNY